MHIRISLILILLLPAIVKSEEIIKKHSYADKIYKITEIKFEGNKLTREYIIRRELIINENDTFNTLAEIENALRQCRDNLMNTALFNFVNYAIEEESGNVSIIFSFVERWYIWPLPIAEIADRNINIWWEEKNWDKVDLGFIFAHNNFLGRRHKVGGIFRFGYNHTYALSYDAPYINKNKTFGLGFVAGMNANHEVSTMLKNNKPQYYKSENEFARTEHFISIRPSYRKGIHFSHSADITYSKFIYADTLLIINPDFIPSGENSFGLLSLSYLFKADFRNYKAYPLSGYYADAEIRRYLFLNNENADYSALKTSFRKYFVHGHRFYSAFGLTAMMSENKARPYLLSGALGIGRDFIRGYEYYLITGQQYIYEKANVKYNIFPERVFLLPLIRSTKFNKLPLAAFTNIFFDAGYVKDNHSGLNNTLANSYLYGYGLSIDLVTYYDKVIRIEYSTNHKNERGLFVHLIAPI